MLDKGQKYNYHMNRIHIYTECCNRWCSILTSAVMKSSVRVNNCWLSSVLRNRILTNSKRHQGCSNRKASGINPLDSTKVLNTQREKSNKLSRHWFYVFWRFENKPEDFSKRSGYILSFEKGTIKERKWEGVPFLFCSITAIPWGPFTLSGSS